MEIHITEHKSTGTLKAPDYTARVFVDRDYGYFVARRLTRSGTC